MRLGIEHAVSVDELCAAYPLLDVIDHDKSRAAVRITQHLLLSILSTIHLSLK